MPPKRSPESKEAKECILQIGKFNNVVAWNLEMRALTVTTFGSSATFLTTNVRFVYPLPREEDFLVAYPAGPDDLPPLVMSAALIADCKKDAFTGRQRDIRKQKENDKMIWGAFGRHHDASFSSLTMLEIRRSFTLRAFRSPFTTLRTLGAVEAEVAAAGAVAEEAAEELPKQI